MLSADIISALGYYSGSILALIIYFIRGELAGKESSLLKSFFFNSGKIIM